jgi:hypothetical protein
MEEYNMWLNHNDNTKINVPREITVNGVTYPKQVFNDEAFLNTIGIFKATVGAMADQTLFTNTEVIDWVTNTVSYNSVARTEEEIRSLTVPISITKVQAMKAMKQAGVWETFKSAIASNEDALDEWTLALDLVRDNPFVAMLAPALGLTDTQIDDLFILGSTL